MTSDDISEIRKFEALSDTWWDVKGPLRTLHEINKLRIAHIMSIIKECYGPNVEALKVLDIGCGGGILTEGLYNSGLINIYGIDPSKKNIAVAQKHAGDLNIRYCVGLVEDLLTKSGFCHDIRTFDLVLSMETVEHVNNQEQFILDCFNLVKNNGIMIVSTINRTLSSLLFAKVMAEYVLRWLPRGTHDWRKFMRPSEIVMPLESCGGHLYNLIGIKYDILSQRFDFTDNLNVNYIASIRK